MQDYNCILCNSASEESLVHLFILCPFAVQCWAWLQIQVDHNNDPFLNLQNFKEQLQVPFFMEIIIIMCWAIWKARNDFIFRQINPSLQSTKVFSRDEFQLLSLRTKRSFFPLIEQWLESLVCSCCLLVRVAVFSFLLCSLSLPLLCRLLVIVSAVRPGATVNDAGEPWNSPEKTNCNTHTRSLGTRGHERFFFWCCQKRSVFCFFTSPFIVSQIQRESEALGGHQRT